MEAGGMLAGRYRLVAPVARGAQGTVWRAVDTHSGDTDVAVKVSGGAGLESLLRLVCEQSVRLGHPHVLTPVDWFVREGEAWLVLPLVRGGTLAGLLADYGGLPPRVGLVLGHQLLDALAAVHDAGLVHRDVKPSNLLLEASGTGRPHLWLGDFGVARVLPHLRLTATAFAVGTPDYLAPEVRAGGQGGPAQDVYAAGLVLRALGAPAALVAAMTAPDPAARPTARAAGVALARALQELGPERWPVLWEGEPFLVPDHFTDAPHHAVDVPGAVSGTPPTTLPPSPPSRPSPPSPSSLPPSLPSSPQASGARGRRGVTAVVVLGAVAVTAAVTAVLTARADGDGPGGAAASAGPPGTTAPARTVPARAETGPPDPEGPAVFSPCPADEALAVAFSPEGYLLRCDHVAGTARYEWTPRLAED